MVETAVKMMNWVNSHKLEAGVLLSILVLAAFFRLYRLPQYMTFLGDEGRDALMVKRILTTFDLPLLGPPTSIGNMYLGPLYYYMMSVPMAVFWLNPVAAAGMVALIGVATVGLIYCLSREWFGPVCAVTASLLYAVSPVTIAYSRSSWNPNPAPLFALLAFLGLYWARKKGNFYYFILTGASLAFAVQMHYLALILLPITGLLWGYELYARRGKSKKGFVLASAAAVLAFLFLMSPLLIFDIKHNFVNFRNVSTFFTDRQTTVNLNIFNTLGRILPIYKFNLIERYMSGSNPAISAILAVVVVVPLLVSLKNYLRQKKGSWSCLALGVWLAGGVVGLALYKQSVYDHYLGFLNPAPYILLGSLTVYLRQSWKLPGALAIILIVGFLNIQKSPLFIPPNNQLDRTQQVAKFIINESLGQPFNFALIAKNNYDAAYQFYLDIYGQKPKELPFEIADQLFVVCEDSVCEPINHPKYEIAAFGWAKIAQQKDFQGVKVFKLEHNPTGKENP